MHHFKVIRGHYAKSNLAIKPGLYFLKNVICVFFFFLFFLFFVFCFFLFLYLFFFFSFSFTFFSFISRNFRYVAVYRTVDIVKERSGAMPLLNILIYNKIIKQTVKQAVHVQNMSGLIMLQFKVNYVLSRIKHNS